MVRIQSSDDHKLLKKANIRTDGADKPRLCRTKSIGKSIKINQDDEGT